MKFQKLKKSLHLVTISQPHKYRYQTRNFTNRYTKKVGNTAPPKLTNPCEIKSQKTNKSDIITNN